MVEFDHSWSALLSPDAGKGYFKDFHAFPFKGSSVRYEPINALWLCELSRWIYRNNHDNYRAIDGTLAHPELQRIGLKEELFFADHGMQAALLVSLTRPKWGVLVFRGSSEPTNWMFNLKTNLVPWFGGGLVHQGFLEALMKVWQPIRRYLEDVKIPLFYTGHSLGAAMATLAAADRRPAALYLYGAPRVGEQEFSSSLSGVPVYRVVNHLDLVCSLPPATPPFSFRHVGELHYFSYAGNKYVNPDDDFLNYDQRIRTGASRAAMHERGWTDPPKRLSDHSPINYTANVYREVLKNPINKSRLESANEQNKTFGWPFF